MNKRTLGLLLTVALFAPLTAQAADLPPLKAPLRAPLLPIFYGGAGFYCGAGPGGEATKIAAAGVTQAVYEAGMLLNLNCGYTMAVGPDRWAAFQANYAYANTDAKILDASGAVVSLDRRQSIDLKVMYGAPLSVLSGIFSNAGAGFPTLPPVPADGINSSMHPYIAAGVRASEDNAFDGFTARHKTHVKGLLGLGAMYQTNRNTTINTFVDWTFGSARFLLTPGAEIKQGSTFRFGTVVNYGVGG